MYKSKYSKLINHLTSEHDLILLDSEIQEIENFVDKDLEAIDVIPCCTELPTKKEIIFDDSLMAEIETTDKNLKVLRAVNGWGNAIDIAKVKVNDK
jgi:hypothetical protein